MIYNDMHNAILQPALGGTPPQWGGEVTPPVGVTQHLGTTPSTP